MLQQEGVGCIPFSPLAQGLLTNKYLHGIPEDSRAARPHGFLKQDQVNDKSMSKIRQLNSIALQREQSLAQMALSWLLKDNRITSVLVGASRPAQLEDSLKSLQNTSFTNEELLQIEDILNG